MRFHIDIPIIKTKLDKGLYYCVQDVVDDIELLWSNCINYFATNGDDYRKSLDISSHLESFLEQRDKTRHCIEEMAQSISVFQPIGDSKRRES